MPLDCTYCSSSINDGDAFCQSCGRQVVPANGAGALAENPEPTVAAAPTGGLPSWATVPPTGGLPAAAPVRSMPSAADDFYRGSDLYIALRYDYARAMRETMHSATREGVDVAIGRMAAQGQGIIGTAIPVTEHAVTE
jgi:hypothetical protein